MPGFNINGTGGEASGLTEVARSHRWRVFINGGAPSISKEILLAAKDATRPSVDIDTITYHHKSNQIYMPGKYKWPDTVDIVFYEYVNSSLLDQTASEFFNYWSSQVYDLQTNNIINNYKRIVLVNMLDGLGNVVYDYILEGAWPSKVSPSSLSYTTSDLATTKVSFRYDLVSEG